MLVLTRRTEESIVIQERIIVTVLSIDGDRVKLGIDAPREISIHRQELVQAVKEQNLAVAKKSSSLITPQLQTIQNLLISSKDPIEKA